VKVRLVAWASLSHSDTMRHRDLTIRVYGPFSSTRYAVLAHQIGSHLTAEGLADQAVLVPDRQVTGAELADAASHASCGRQLARAGSAGETSGADGEGVGQAAGVGQVAADADD
jgi:hypothetical protein